ncbi:MAG: hypothetical protein NE328_19040 [Lentisphaeraceae bacterium]|nr:hypothetical protein [Lentisphaeraceae bacterium]
MRLRFLSGLLLLAATGCISTKSEVDVKPIKVTIDVNIKIEMDKDLKDIFKDIDNRQEILQDEGEVEKEGNKS